MRYFNTQKAGRSPISTSNPGVRQEVDRTLFHPQASSFVSSPLSFPDHGSNLSGSQLNPAVSPHQYQWSQSTPQFTNAFATKAFQAPSAQFQNPNVGYDPRIQECCLSANWEWSLGGPTNFNTHSASNYPITVNPHDTSTLNHPRTQVTHTYGEHPVNSRAQLPPKFYIESLGNERASVGQQPPVTRGHSPSSLRNSFPPSPSVTSDDQSFNSATTRDVHGGFRCSTCGRAFARMSRLENCQNKHKGLKPYMCSGTCGRVRCSKEFASKALLARHCRPLHARYRHCDIWLRVMRQNWARHARSCLKNSKF